MAAGNNTFINDMLTRMGLYNVMNQETSRYPELRLEDLPGLKADFVFLSSEPYPFKEQHINELQQILPKAKICLVDGELFSWYGSRLKHTTAYLYKLQQTLHIG